MLDRKRMDKYIQTGKDLEPFENIESLYNPPELPAFKFTEENIRNAIDNLDVSKMRDISSYFYYASKTYSRLIDLFANMLTFDYLIIPKDNSKNKNAGNADKIQQELSSVLSVFKQSRAKQEFRQIAKTVLIEGVFYGYLIFGKDSWEIQELAYKYCTTSFEYKGIPIIEFNLEYFDREFTDTGQRELVLEMYPQDISDAYDAYKNGGSKIFYVEPKNSLVFSLDENYVPYFVSIVLDIIRYSNYKAIDEIRNEQEILKLIIQRLPVNKDGTLMFSGDEMTILHDVVATMLEDMPSVDLITSYAEIKTENLQEQRSSMQNSMSNAKENIYSGAGVSEQLMNATGNVALDLSLKTDEGIMFNLLESIKNFFQFVLDVEYSSKKLSYDLIMPELTIYNRQEWFARYLEAGQYGFGKLLVVLAMGIEQDVFINLMDYENNILDITSKLIPLQSSHTSSGDDKGGNPGKGETKIDDKTIVNRNND